MALSREQEFLKIAELAYTLWDSYEAQNRVDLGNPKDPLFEFALRFYRHSVKFLNSSQKPAEAYFQIADLSVHVQRFTRQARGKPASWLWRLAGNDPCIVVDVEYVRQVVGYTEAEKIIARLILHETAHWVLHRIRLMPATASKPALLLGINNANEEEAWWFCEIIIGLAVGFHAKSLRQQNYHDVAFPFS